MAIAFQLVDRDATTYFEFPVNALFIEISFLAGLSSGEKAKAQDGKEAEEKFYLIDDHDLGVLRLCNHLPAPGCRNFTEEILSLREKLHAFEETRAFLQAEKKKFLQDDCLKPEIIARLEEEFAFLDKPFNFNAAERELLQEVITGCSDQWVAEDLGRLPAKMRKHLALIPALPRAEFEFHITDMGDISLKIFYD